MKQYEAARFHSKNQKKRNKTILILQINLMIMKSFYTCCFYLLIAFSTVAAQNLTNNKPQYISNTFTSTRNEIFKDLNNSKISSITDTNPMKVSLQSNKTSYLLDSVITTTVDGINSNKSRFNYDSKGNRILGEYYSWDKTNNYWIYTNKFEDTFDSLGNNTLDINYEWNKTNNNWVNAFKWESSYDSINNKNLEFYYDWINNAWTLSQRIEYFYDNDGNKSNVFKYFYSQIMNNESKDVYTYDNNGKATKYTNYHWDKTSQSWSYSFKNEFKYNTEGNLTMETHYSWNNYDSIWIAGSQYEYFFDNNGNNNSWVYSNWDNSNNVFVGINKYEYIRDNNGNISQLLSYKFSTEWYLNKIGNYYFSTKDLTGIKNVTSMHISISPNPTTNEIRINGLNEQTKFSLIDYNGKLLMTRDIEDNESIKLNSLSKGIYLVRLINSEVSYVSKIIKE